MFRQTQLRRTRLAMVSQSAQSTSARTGSDLQITAVKSWTLREPVSKRAYSVVKVQARSGLVGFGECAPLTAAEFTAARKAIIGQPATSFEAIALLLAESPTARAALNIAMLDVIGQAIGAPIFQVLGGPTRAKARALVAIDGDTEATLINSLQRGQEAGFRAF